jgi:uncharacterized membrane-anchored protein
VCSCWLWWPGNHPDFADAPVLVAFVLTRPLGASAGDFVSKPVAAGGMGYGTIEASVLLGSVLVALIGYVSWQQRCTRAIEHAG